jgi:hypothetical protein
VSVEENGSRERGGDGADDCHGWRNRAVEQSPDRGQHAIADRHVQEIERVGDRAEPTEPTDATNAHTGDQRCRASGRERDVGVVRLQNDPRYQDESRPEASMSDPVRREQEAERAGREDREVRQDRRGAAAGQKQWDTRDERDARQAPRRRTGAHEQGQRQSHQEIELKLDGE